LCNSDRNSDLQKKFDAYCKIVIKNAARNIIKKKRYISENEITLSSFDTVSFHEDTYFNNENCFDVYGTTIAVSKDIVAEVLLSLSDIDCKIVLMYYYMNMTDGQISERTSIPLSTVHYRRHKALDEMKIYLEKAGCSIDN
jgi:DNA-directed RNA polymerase specialized sigma subunit, sigma24 homolog